MIEFTGERVIPGEVNDDLWAEHTARYAFAARYARGPRALDLGCGTGYGVADLAAAVPTAIGIDSAAEAIGYARAHFYRSNTRFLQASADALPFADRSFSLITAFEVIEHLDNWPVLLREARRVSAPRGMFLVSTPNKLYYAESRAKEGPNPFHTHEFEFDEFRDALHEFFPYVSLFLQNRLESFAFSPVTANAASSDARIDRSPAAPAEANFFVAACSLEPQSEPRPFVYVPRASNLLREREQHIHLLEDELRQTKQWLDTLIGEHKTLQDLHVEQTRHLEDQNLWARDIETKWRQGMERISQLQSELQAEQAQSSEVVAGYNRKVGELEAENRAKTDWALEIETRLSHELAAKCAELAETARLLDRAEATVNERTVWAQDLEKRVEDMQARLAQVRESRWIKLGRAAGLGPRVDD